MKITASQQAALDAHLTATIPGTPATQHRAPRAFDGVIAALVDPAEIEGSHGEYQRLQPARWRVWVVTSTHLAYVEIKFDNEDDYDADEEANRVIAPGQPFIRDPARGVGVGLGATACYSRKADLGIDRPRLQPMGALA